MPGPWARGTSISMKAGVHSESSPSWLESMYCLLEITKSRTWPAGDVRVALLGQAVAGPRCEALHRLFEEPALSREEGGAGVHDCLEHGLPSTVMTVLFVT
mmetsp:Transcript_80717/g.193604  ORF Transcript_80717/g.193604 Transcript_80717/m.193604 type:complete len:101 (-) Transcript_80717:1199-1501(-)